MQSTHSTTALHPSLAAACKLLQAALAGLACSAALAAPLNDQQVIGLWQGAAPGSEQLAITEVVTERSKDTALPDRAYTQITRPTLTAYLPAQPNGAAALVVPGGAYARVVSDKEGADIARMLNARGVTAFVLKYRLPGEGHARREDVPLQDAQRAMRLIRANAAEWKLDGARVLAMGMSAGGHLVATLGTQSGKRSYAPTDAADQLDARPDRLVLLYPVISMDDKLTHAQSREMLLGKAPEAARLAEFSNELHVGKTTPPSFVLHAADDPAVPPENSIVFYRALLAAGVPAELHVLRSGGHGFGIRQATGSATQWPQLLGNWLGAENMLVTR